MIIAIDTGGTKTLIAAFDDAGHIVKKERFATPKNFQEYEATLIETLKKSFKKALATTRAIAIALPVVIRDNTIVGGGNIHWENEKIVEHLQHHFPHVLFFLENDANLAGLAETRLLAHCPKISLYLTISTGIGTGICTNGSIDPALSGSEGGAALLPYKNQLLQWQDFGSGRAIVQDFGKTAEEIDDPATWKTIVKERFLPGFLALIPFIEPEVIIIGGSVGVHFKKYSQFLNEMIHTALPRYIQRPAIVQALHPENAVLYGCYEYAKDLLCKK